MDEQNTETNARRMWDRSHLETLRDAGLTSCFVSIHGPEPDLHDGLTQSRGAFSQTCGGVANLEHIEMPFVTDTLIIKQNYRLLSELVTFLGRTFPSICKIKLTYPRLHGGAAENLSHVIAPLWEVAPFVRDAIDSGVEERVYVKTEFVPICLLGTRHDHTAKFSMTRVNLSDLTHSSSNYSSPAGKIFYDVSNRCDVQNQCLDIDTLHHEAFGEESCFTPVAFADMAY